MPARPQIENGQAVSYRTKVLGCQIVLEAPATPHSMSVAEAVLGTIEAFFATSLDERIMPYRSIAKIIVEAESDLTEGLRVTEENINGDAFVRVQHPAVTSPFTVEARRKYRDGLMMLIAPFIVHVTVVENFASYTRSSLPGLTRQSMLRPNLRQVGMDARVKPAHDEAKSACKSRRVQIVLSPARGEGMPVTPPHPPSAAQSPATSLRPSPPRARRRRLPRLVRARRIPFPCGRPPECRRSRACCGPAA
jgi:hypothetical protein